MLRCDRLRQLPCVEPSIRWRNRFDVVAQPHNQPVVIVRDLFRQRLDPAFVTGLGTAVCVTDGAVVTAGSGVCVATTVLRGANGVSALPGFTPALVAAS